MSQNNHVRLMARMNENEVKHPQTEAMLNLLKALFSEEQAALIGDFPLGAYTTKSLSEKIGRDEGELDKMLKQMSAEGLIFEGRAENGEAEYSVLAFEPGLIEMQYLKGNDDERTRKFVGLMNQVHEEESDILKESLKQPEKLKENLSEPMGRLLAIEENISNDKEVASWEKLSEIIEKETSYAVGECACKHIAKLSGNPCQSGAPTECCVWFGDVADYLVDRGYAKPYTKEEIFKLFKECEEAGLVHFTTNRTNSKNIVMCNCCKCCCGYLDSVKLARESGIQLMETSNFMVGVDEETCTGCGECVEYCQLEVLDVSDDIISINEEYCLGCGSCVSKCPTKSLSLARVSHKKPPESTFKVVGSGV